MTAYLDTSALVKLYADEPGTVDVRRAVSRATSLSTSRITYVEARAAFARRYRERGLARGQYGEVVRALEHEWEAYVRLDVTEPIVKLAGELTERYGLRAYDALHLASALSLQQDAHVEFIAADGRLIAAAAKEGLTAHQVVA